MTKKIHDCPHCNKKSKESVDNIVNYVIDDIYDE